MLSAVAAQLTLGHSFEGVVIALSQIRPVAGRAEFFRQANNADIVVDYAHTPDALKQLLCSLRLHCRGRLIVVLGVVVTEIMVSVPRWAKSLKLILILSC